MVPGLDLGTEASSLSSGAADQSKTILSQASVIKHLVENETRTRCEIAETATA